MSGPSYTGKIFFENLLIKLIAISMYHDSTKYSATLIRYTRGMVKLYHYIGVSLYRNSRYSDIAVKILKISLYQGTFNMLFLLRVTQGIINNYPPKWR